MYSSYFPVDANTALDDSCKVWCFVCVDAHTDQKAVVGVQQRLQECDQAAVDGHVLGTGAAKTDLGRHLRHRPGRHACQHHLLRGVPQQPQGQSYMVVRPSRMMPISNLVEISFDHEMLKYFYCFKCKNEEI